MSTRGEPQVGDIVHYEDGPCRAAIVTTIGEMSANGLWVDLAVVYGDGWHFNIQAFQPPDGKNWHGCWHWAEDCRDART